MAEINYHPGVSVEAMRISLNAGELQDYTVSHLVMLEHDCK
jgi:hypothetical protein